MKYYLRSIREDGFGECVLPTEKFGRADHWNIESEMEHNNAYEAFMEYISSLPVSALAHPDLAKKIGWVENVEEDYQVNDYLGKGSMSYPFVEKNNQNTRYGWYRVDKRDYDKICDEDRRILLVEKKQEEKSEVDELAPEEKELLHWWRDARKCVKSGKFSIADERLQKCKDILGDANDYV